MKALQNMKITSKILFGCSVIALIGAIVGVIGLLNVKQIQNRNRVIYETDTAKMINLVHLAGQYEAERGAIKEYYIIDPGQRKAVIDGLKANDDLINQCIGDLKRGVAESSDEFKVITKYEGVLSQFRAFRDKAIGLVDSGKIDEAKSLLTGKDAAAMADNMKNATVDIVVFKMDRAKQNCDGIDDMASTFVIVMVIAIFVGVLMSLALGFIIARGISKPIQVMTGVAEQLSTGDIESDGTLSDRKLTERGDEIGKFARAFNKLVGSTKDQVVATNKIAEGDLTAVIAVRSDRDQLGKGLSSLTDSLNDLVVSIITSADQVASGADLVSSTSVALSQGASTQASTIQQLSASLEEIAAQTNINAKNAKKANALTANAKENAQKGNARMKEMLNAMEEINLSSSGISKIIKVIDDIAFQTNILALNAAVEAARAGQYGKGFAVVAEEVRTLAGKSARAASETTEMIEGSIRKVEAGTKIANETAGALKLIVEEVANAAELVGDIANASQQQQSGIEQINQGLQQVSVVVQTNVATSEESAAASEELSSQAASLKEIVGVFKLKKTAGIWDSSGFSGPANSKSAGRKSTGISLTPSPKQPIALSSGELSKY